MDNLTARPRLLKQANLSLIRRVIKTKGTATRAEIAEETKISSTTVRSLLVEMLQDGEIQSIGYDESSGGRKAERYGLRPDKYYSVAFCITDNQVHSLLVNICGEILGIDHLKLKEGDFEQAIISYLDGLVLKKEIKSIGIGVPGVVEGGCFWRKNVHKEGFYRIDIGEKLSGRYQIPVILENDINATAIGFGREGETKLSCQTPEKINMAYLYFEDWCISGGFIAGGRIVRGFHNYAGELGLVPLEDGKLLADTMSEAMADDLYIKIAVQSICWICGILNPQYVVLGGPGLRKNCVEPIRSRAMAQLPKHMLGEIFYSPDVWRDYHAGMAWLTASKMFDEIQFIKD